ncbi:hypothetical protein BDN70DRAFT_939304 [Pholiota conissans]|uniref:Uncharacterized protein n=1 Tax=Pholiota conissans TaxID=109636 RepID=A0A9P5YL72_9AGAR|nr:hypothetical protein BDN70DRAFT_939304 [Pholiota conissans]
MPPSFAWRTAGVNIPPPTAQSLTQPVPKRFSDLRFSPDGTYDLRRMQDAVPEYPGEYSNHQDQFNGSDIAWFATNCSTDNRQVIGPNEYHPVLEHIFSDKFGPESRRKLREQTQKLVLDAATLWDRAFGGSTIVIHVDPPTSLGIPTAPEHLKAITYLPPIVVSELPQAHQAIADIVQSFIVNVGLHTKTRWERLKKPYLPNKSRKKLPLEPTISSDPIPPPLLAGSSLYLFQGRKTDPSAASSTAPLSSKVNSRSAKSSVRSKNSASSTLVPENDDDMYDSDSDSDMYPVQDEVSSSYVAAFDVADMEIERLGFQEKVKNFETDISLLKESEKKSKDKELAYKKEIKSLKQAIKTLQISQHTQQLDSTTTFSLQSPFLGIKAPNPSIASSISSVSSLSSDSSNLFAATLPSPFLSNPVNESATPRRGNEKPKDTVVEPATPSKFTSRKGTLLSSNMATKVSSPTPYGAIASSVTSTPLTMSTHLSFRNPDISLADLKSQVQAPLPVVGAAPRAVHTARLCGYEESRLPSLHIIATYVAPPFWAKALSTAGFQEEDDVDRILRAMMEDMRA